MNEIFFFTSRLYISSAIYPNGQLKGLFPHQLSKCLDLYQQIRAELRKLTKLKRATWIVKDFTLPAFSFVSYWSSKKINEEQTERKLLKCVLFLTDLLFISLPVLLFIINTLLYSSSYSKQSMKRTLNYYLYNRKGLTDTVTDTNTN